MHVRTHHDPKRFWAVAGPLYRADPTRHTVALTVQRRVLDAGDAGQEPAPVMITVHRDGVVAGAAFRTPPYPLIASGLGADETGAADRTDLMKQMDAVAATWHDLDPTLPTVTGPRDRAEPFAAAWARRTGVARREATATRLYRLGELERPVVAGCARPAADHDVGLLASWTVDFLTEAMRQLDPGSEERTVRRAMAIGDDQVLWEVDGQVVAWAHASAPIEGMSRIGPVYTPPEHRGCGYGSAVTAAASDRALRRGARHVLLFTDLANPTSNSIYQRIGYRPVLESADIEFVAAGSA